MPLDTAARRTMKSGDAGADAPRGDAWRSEQVASLYTSMPAAVGVAAVLGLTLALVQWDAVAPWRAALWIAVLAGVSAARIAMGSAYRRTPADQRRHAAWLRRFRIGAAAAGLTWGLGAFLLFPANDLPHQAFLAFAIAGVSAGAAISLAADRVALVSFAAPALVVLVAQFLAERGGLQLSMAAMI